MNPLLANTKTSVPGSTVLRLKRTLSDKCGMSFNVAMHYPVITVYYAASNKH